jgi:hypothetical protein
MPDRDPEQIQAVDYIGSQLRFSGYIEGSYWLPDCYLRLYAGLPYSGSAIRGWRRIRFLFQARHGISNTDRCAEGASPGDKYQIVQSVFNDEEEYRFPFPASIGSYFQPVAHFGSYQVFRRYWPGGEQVRR